MKTRSLVDQRVLGATLVVGLLCGCYNLLTLFAMQVLDSKTGLEPTNLLMNPEVWFVVAIAGMVAAIVTWFARRPLVSAVLAALQVPWTAFVAFLFAMS
jgi:hypothetical protein